MKVTGINALQKSLDDTSRRLNREVESVLKQEARALCVSLSFYTSPRGFNDPSEKEKRKVSADVARVYSTISPWTRTVERLKTIDQRLAMAFWQAIRNGNEAKARKYLRKAGVSVESLNPTFHRKARTGTGGSVPADHVADQVVKAASLERYINIKKATMGVAKAGWCAAARALGGRIRTNNKGTNGYRTTTETFPPFVRKLASKYANLGGATITPRKVVIFTNVRHGADAIAEWAFQTAFDQAQQSFNASIKDALSKVIKQFRRAA